MAFQQGLSGLNAAAKNLDVIGHNIANANTTGFKGSRAEFADIMVSSMGMANAVESGYGVQVAAVAQQFKQGSLTNTGNSLDVAINGGGFFQVQQPNGTLAYTRAGDFKMDQFGNLKTNGGAGVMGYRYEDQTTTDAAGKTSTTRVLSASTAPISLPTGAPINAKQTTEITASFNLDARATNARGNPSATPPVSPTPRSTYGTSINVYDSQGVAKPLNLYFEKNGANTWDTYTQLDDLTTSPATVPATAGRMIMDGNGKLTATVEPLMTAASVPNADSTKTQKDDFPKEFVYRFYGPDNATPPVFGIREAKLTFANPEQAWDFTYSDGPANTLVSGARLKEGLITYNATGAAPVIAAGGTLTPADPKTAPLVSEQSFQLALAVNPNPSNSNSPPATGGNPAPAAFSVTMNLSQVTQFGSQFAVSDLSQDGYASGELTGVTIAQDGTVMASYSNGMSRAEAQVALANFRNPQGLIEIGGNNWIESPSSGSVVLGKPGSGQFGSLRSRALEDSNVDLTAELVGMITAQRAYQANAQTIKTQDQVMSTIVNLR